MEQGANIPFEQLLKLIHRLSVQQLAQLNAELSELQKEKKNHGSISEFQKFLLSGPIMSDGQFTVFQKLRQNFNQWRRH